MAVLIFIIILDIAVMAIILRLVTTEPPHKHPSAHPLALQYATRPEAPAPLVPEETAPTPSALEAAVEESASAADEDEGKTALGE